MTTLGLQEASSSRRRFWRILLLIVLAGIGLRVGYVLAVTQHDRGFYDAAFYEFEARSVADGRGFVYPLPGLQAGQPAADHPPLTILALVPASKLPGNSRLWMRFTMVAFGAAVVVLIGLLGQALAGDGAGLVAAAIGAVYANLWMNDGLLMSETLAALTTVGALVLAYQFMRRPTWRTAAGLGVVCGLAVLTRAELVLLVPLLALPVVWVARRDRTAGLRGAAVMLGGTLLVVGPWVGFNLARFQDPTFVSTGDGFALLGANCAASYQGPLDGLWAVSCLPPTMPRGDQSVVNLDYRNRAIDYARDHAGHLPVEVLARLGRLLGIYNPGQIARYNAGEGRPEWATYLGTASLFVLLPFALGGGLWLRRRRGRVWPLLAPVWVVLLAAAVFYGTPRFRTPAEPVVVVLAAIGSTALLGRWWPSLAPDPSVPGLPATADPEGAT